MSTKRDTPPLREVADGLVGGEGPVAMDDGSVIVMESGAGRITRITPDGRKQTVATPGGGPLGAAIGPDGGLYVCNWGGWVERVEIATGKTERLYSACDGRALDGPNDIVFDSTGGFWFTDTGKTTALSRHNGALYYARADGSSITRVLPHVMAPNGVALAPDETSVYFTETLTARLWSLPLTAPGVAAPVTRWPGTDHDVAPGMQEALSWAPAHFVGAQPGFSYFDGMAVQQDGGVCVATLADGGITTFWPGTDRTARLPVADWLVTNICFGGKDMRTAFIVASGAGRLLAADWPTPGLRLAYAI